MTVLIASEDSSKLNYNLYVYNTFTNSIDFQKYLEIARI